MATNTNVTVYEFIAFACAVLAVINIPIVGFWWNTLVFAGTYTLVSSILE
jgi:hypothetical protein